MIKVIEKYINQQEISLDELGDFICKYCRAKNHREPTPIELQGLYQMFQMKIFDIEKAIEDAVQFTDKQIYKIHDVNGRLIKMYLE